MNGFGEMRQAARVIMKFIIKAKGKILSRFESDFHVKCQKEVLKERDANVRELV